MVSFGFLTMKKVGTYRSIFPLMLICCVTFGSGSSACCLLNFIANVLLFFFFFLYKHNLKNNQFCKHLREQS